MKALLRPALVLWLAALSATASEQVRRVQEELRRRNLYFGEVDGRESPEVSGALRAFQLRKGFAAQGALTPETLRALEVPAAPGGPVAEEWPEGPVLRSDTARQIAEAVQAYLREQATGEPPPIQELVQDAPAPRPPTTEPSPPVNAAPEAKGEAPARAGLSEGQQDETRRLVERYLAACERPTPEEELAFYGERVDYFDHGVVDRTFIARDVKRFCDRWPRRKYRLLDCQLLLVNGVEREISFQIAFDYSGDRRVSGRTTNFFRVREEASGPRFTLMKERRLRP